MHIHSSMKKVLMYITTKDLSIGGIERYVLNLTKKLIEDDFKVDIVVPGKVNKSFISDELESLGCKLYSLNVNWNSPFRYISTYFKTISFVKDNNYDIVHVHFMTYFISATILSSLKAAGVKKRVAHSHTTPYKVNFIHELYRKAFRSILVNNATDLVACSKVSALYTYGEGNLNRTKIAINGIDTSKFKYDSKIRDEIRKEFGITDNQYIIANTARIVAEKNPLYLLDVFKKYHVQNPNSVLWLIGDGDWKPRVLEYISRYNLNDSVNITGMRDDVFSLLQAVDIIISPSIFEGFSISLIEAESTGLPIITSDSVSKEIDLTGNVSFLNLNDDVSEWVACIERYRKNYTRVDCSNIVYDKGYDLENLDKVVLEVYNE